MATKRSEKTLDSRLRGNDDKLDSCLRENDDECLLAYHYAF